jgi:hypothetical protein
MESRISLPPENAMDDVRRLSPRSGDISLASPTASARISHTAPITESGA